MRASSRWLVYFALGCSGAAALIYETAWTRQLGLLMGHSLAAASTVLAAFMLGLAAGTAIGGRIAARAGPAAALRTYAVLEILIGVLALLLPAELASLRPLLSWSYGDGAGSAFGIVRVISAVVVVTVPALAMGATLPLVVRWAVGPAMSAARDTARLYAANTFGAAAGAIASGFVLLPAFGTQHTTWLAVAMNAAAAVIAWRISRTSPVRESPSRAPISAGRSRTSGAGNPESLPVPVPRAGTVAAFALAISGASSLILQVSWTRLLALVVGPTTYAFSAMVATFIAGIAFGSLAGGWLGRRGPAPGALAVSMLLSGSAALAAAAWVPQSSLIVANAVSGLDSSFARVMWLQSMLIAAAMLPMTLGFGAAFPLAVGLVVRDERPVAADVAAVYIANTLGAIAGALAGGFLLIPRLGLEGAVRTAALLVMGGAVVVVMAAGARKRRTAVILVAVSTAVVIWITPPWDRALLSSGAYKYAPYLPAEHRDTLLRAGTLLYYREGAASTVSVRRLAGAVSLAIDGKIDASNAGDMLTQRLLAHVPLLLHPNPRRVAIIGLGSGVTLGSALTHPIERVDTIEISREVIEASHQFDSENGWALKDARSKLIVGDGRSHMMLGRNVYDVVISEPSNPWIAGVAGLFTREMFGAIRNRLAPDGIVCQWAHAYDMSSADLRSIVATFIDVFPYAMLWPIGEGDVLLVGSQQAIQPRLGLMRRGWQRPGVSANLAGVRVTGPDVLLSLAAADQASLRVFAAGAPIQQDDRLALEFTGPRSIFGRAPDDGAAALRTFVERTAPPDPVRESAAHRRDRGVMLLGAEAFDSAAAELLAAVELDPTDSKAIDALIRAAGPAGKVEDAERRLRTAMVRGAGHGAAAIGVSRILASRGEFEEAAAVIRPFVEATTDAALLEQLASVYADAGDPNRLTSVVAGLRSIAPADEPAAYFAAVLQLMTGKPRDALETIGQVRNRSTIRARDLTLEGTAYAAIGRKDDARRAFASAIAADPRDVTGYENLATFEVDSGNDRAASALFAEALILDPASKVAREGLAAALRRRR